MQELIRTSQARDKAEEELLQAIRDDTMIAETIKDYWLNRSNMAD